MSDKPKVVIVAFTDRMGSKTTHHIVPIEKFGDTLPTLEEMARINRFFDCGDGEFIDDANKYLNEDDSQIAADFYSEEGASEWWAGTELKSPMLTGYEVVALFSMGFGD